LTIALAGTDMLITSPPSRLPGDLERGAGPGRALEEAIDDRAAAQQAALLLSLPVKLDIAVGEVEDVVDVVRRQAVDPEQMPVREPGLDGALLHEPGTIGGVPPPGNNNGGAARTWRLSASSHDT
jgi:hypothetical protein